MSGRRLGAGTTLLSDHRRGVGPGRSRLGRCIRTRKFLTEAAAAEAVSAVHAELFGPVRPAATMVIVAGLLDSRWKVEVEAEAEIDPDRPVA
jgi:enamine deaminase RidA (YjgF/YER057c/UK114 family)